MAGSQINAPHESLVALFQSRLANKSGSANQFAIRKRTKDKLVGHVTSDARANLIIGQLPVSFDGGAERLRIAFERFQPHPSPRGSIVGN